MSQRAFGLARELGVRMAQEDKVIRPRLFNLGGDKEYERFRDTHRAYWEQSDQFDQVWQPRILTLAEREAHRLSISDSISVVNWERSHNRIVNPLKSAMWEAWERVFGLEYLYEQAVSRPFAGADLPIKPMLQDHASGQGDGEPTWSRGLYVRLVSLFH